MVTTKPLIPLCCSLCDTEIFAFDNIYKRMKRKPEYAEMTLFLTSGSRMVVGICKKCLPTIKKRKVTTILNRHKAYWEQEIMLNNALDDKEKTRQIALLDNIIVESWD